MRALFRRPAEVVEDEPWRVEMRQRHRMAHDLAARIERAVTDAGYDANSLMDLPPSYIVAALALGIK